MSVLKSIVDKKTNGKIKSEDKKYYESKILGEKIELEKLPLSHYLDAVGNSSIGEENIGEFIPLINELIFDYATMFRDPDGVKAAMEVYPSAQTPKDLPELIFEGSMRELTDIFELITSFYDGEVDKAKNDIKN